MPEEKKEWNIPRGAAATKAKNKYRDTKYDRIELAVPKGMKAAVKERVKAGAAKSVNEYVANAVKEKMEREGEPFEQSLGME